MKTFSKTIGVLFVVMLVLVAGLFVVTLLPIPGNIGVKIVKSGSMEPVVRTGGIVVIKPVDTYNVGDVITFGEDTRLAIPTTHRIVSLREVGGEVYYTTKGDANEEADPQETRHVDVLGKMVFTLPYAGFIVSFAKEPLGFVLLIAIPAAMVVLYELIGIWSEISKYLERRRAQKTL